MLADPAEEILQGPGAIAITVRRTSSPLVLRILALEFLFELGVGLAPEVGQVVGDLDGAIVRGEDFDADGGAAIGHPQPLFHAVQILNARGNGRRTVGGVSDLGAAWLPLCLRSG